MIFPKVHPGSSQLKMAYCGKVILFTILFTCTNNYIQAQKIDTTQLKILRQYIDPMRDVIGVKLGVTNSIETFEVYNNRSNLRLLPNTSNLLRVYTNFRMISFFFSINPSFFPGNDDDEIRGDTEIGGFGLGFTFFNWFADLGYSRTKGYYLDNTDEHQPGWKPGDPYIQFPELVSNSYEALVGYKVNKKFSQGAVTTQSARQLKSAGTLLPRIVLRYYTLDDKSGAPVTQKSNNFMVTIGNGYQHTFVHKQKWYISAGFTPAVGFIHTKLFTRTSNGDTITNSNHPVFQWDGKIGAGFNSSRFFGGIFFSGAAVYHNDKNMATLNINARGSYQAFIGYHFLAPKAIRSSYDKVYEKIYKKILK